MYRDTLGVCCCQPISKQEKSGKGMMPTWGYPWSLKWNMGGLMPKTLGTFFSGLIFFRIWKAHKYHMTLESGAPGQNGHLNHGVHVSLICSMSPLLLSTPREVLVHSVHDGLESILAGSSQEICSPAQVHESPGYHQLCSKLFQIIKKRKKKKVYKWLALNKILDQSQDFPSGKKQSLSPSAF